MSVIIAHPTVDRRICPKCGRKLNASNLKDIVWDDEEVRETVACKCGITYLRIVKTDEEDRRLVRRAQINFCRWMGGA